MPIFVSYSHDDSDFADRLVAQLVRHRVQVWIDKWELRVGDSLTQRIQSALTDASALLVLLSPSSVKSSWVEREITSGLVRELEERRVVLLPVLVADCQIPLFLRDKFYADFRTDFDEGLTRLLAGISSVANPATGRIDDASFHTDWAITWAVDEDGIELQVTLVEQAVDAPYCVLSRVTARGNAAATARYATLAAAAGEEASNQVVLELVNQALNASGEPLVLVLEDQFEAHQGFTVRDVSSGGAAEYVVRATAQRLGTDTGLAVLYRVGDQVATLLKRRYEMLRSEQDDVPPDPLQR